MGTYYFSVFGICFFFFNIDFNALLAWLDIFPSSQAAARAKPGSKLRCRGGTLTSYLRFPLPRGKQANLSSSPWKAMLNHPWFETARHFELKNSRMQLWVLFAIISVDLGKNASQGLLAPVAKGIFGVGGNSGAGIRGCDFCGMGSCVLHGKAAPCSASLVKK